MPLLKTTLFTMKVPRVDLLVQYKSEYNKLSCSLDQQPLAPDHDLVLMKFSYFFPIHTIYFLLTEPSDSVLKDIAYFLGHMSH